MENCDNHKKTGTLLVSLLIAGNIITANAQNGWEQMKSMTIAKGGSQSCVIDSMIYVFGGWDENLSGLKSAETFNTVINEWIDLKPIPIDVYESNAEAIDGNIYLTGGWRRGITVNTSYTTNSTFKYDPEENSWMEKENCPVNTGTNSSCVLNDKIYILGGLHDFADNDTSGQKSVFVYDPVEDTWDLLPQMIYERAEGAAASVIDNKIYVCGGLHALSEKELFIVGKTEMYDPASNKWTELEDMPVPVVNHISIVHNEKLYVFGGDSGKFTTSKSYGTNIIQEYNPATNEWKLMQNMPFKRGNMTGQKAGSFVYLIGGYLDSRDFHHPFSEVWRFNLDSLKEQSMAYVEIPDTAFLYALINEGVDTNGDSLISYAEAEVIISLDFTLESLYHGFISDMTGIEAFINLNSLDCSNNELTSLDLSNNLALAQLICRTNQLTNLNISGCTLLEDLVCYSNQLTSLDISDCPKLKYLNCGDFNVGGQGNKLTNLDVSNLIALTYLICENNQLNNLNVSGCTSLVDLHCSRNRLTSLDVSGCDALEVLSCSSNQLTSLDVSNNTALEELSIGENPNLTEECVWKTPFPPMGVSVNSEGSPNVNFTTECLYDLIVFIPDSAFLYALIEEGVDINGDSLIIYDEAEAITYLTVSGESISDMTGIEAFINLDTLYCSGNQLTSLNVSNNISLKYLSINENPNLSKVCVWTMPFLTTGVEVFTDGSPNVYFTTECGEAIVEIPDTTFLYTLITKGIDTNCDNLISYAEAEAVSFLDMSSTELPFDLRYKIKSLAGIEAFINLDSLFCNRLQLTSLDVSNNTALISLNCEDNYLTNLDVSGCTALTSLDCFFNQLTSLDVSGCNALTSLECNYNYLTSLDVSSCTALTNLNCSHNHLTSLDVSGCTALTNLNCSKNQLTSLDISNNTSLKWLSIGENPNLTELCVWITPFPTWVVKVFSVGSPNVHPTTDCTTGIEPSLAMLNVNINPNPSINIITIETGIPDIYNIDITSINGELLLNKLMIGTETQLDLSSYKSGIYFIAIRSKDVVITRKIVKY